MGRISGLIKRSSNSAQNDQLTAVIQLQTAVFLWGFTGVLGKAIALNAFILVIYRVMMTAGIYKLYLSWKSISTRLPAKGIKRLGLIGILMAIHWVCFYGAIKLASISVAMVCLATASIFTVFVEAFWKKKKIQRLELTLGMLSLLGVVFIYMDNLDFRAGLLVGILAALLSGIFSVMNKDVVEDYNPAVIAYYELLIGGIALLIISPILLLSQEPVTLFPDAESWLYIFLLSFFCTFIGQLLALLSLKKLSAFTLSLSVNLETFYGILLAFIFYNEQSLLGPKFWWGSALIIVSVLIQSVKSARARSKN